MVEAVSPLGEAYRPGPYGGGGATPGVSLSEIQPGSIVQCAAWPGNEAVVAAAIGKATGLKLSAEPRSGAASSTFSAFGIGPCRLLVIGDEEGLAAVLARAIPENVGTVTDLSHGRTGFRLTGPKAEWVLSKLFAVDFSAKALPLGYGVAANHHDIFAHIQRRAAEQFDIYVFRSFARSFWKTLIHAAEEVGCEVR